jgi:hypothetical protein
MQLQAQRLGQFILFDAYHTLLTSEGAHVLLPHSVRINNRVVFDSHHISRQFDFFFFAVGHVAPRRCEFHEFSAAVERVEASGTLGYWRCARRRQASPVYSGADVLCQDLGS